MKPAPHYSEIDENGLTDEYLIEIAKCVLAWGQCEGQLRALLTALERRPLTDGAHDFFGLAPEDAWKKIKRKLREQGATDSVLEAVQNNRESSRAFYKTRKLLVHTGCVGVWSKNTNYLAFSAFEKFSADELTLYWVPIGDILKSKTFAHATSKLANKIMDLCGY